MVHPEPCNGNGFRQHLRKFNNFRANNPGEAAVRDIQAKDHVKIGRHSLPNADHQTGNLFLQLFGAFSSGFGLPEINFFERL